MNRSIQIVCVATMVAVLSVGTVAGDLSWDPGNDGLGGVGNWNTTDLNWDNTPPPDTDVNVAWTRGDSAFFETGSGVVTINEGGIGVSTITFNSPGGAYTIDVASVDGSLNLTGSTITADTDATLNTKVTAANFSKLGTGALTLNGISGLTGTINATAGTLTLGGPAGLPGGVTGVTFGTNSTLANGSGGLMDWTAGTTTVNGHFRIGAGDAMKFADIDPGANGRSISIDNTTEVSRFTGNRSNVLFGGSGTMTLTGTNSYFNDSVHIRDDLTVVLNGTGENMFQRPLYLSDNATLRLAADNQLGDNADVQLVGSSTLDVNSRTEMIEEVYLYSPDARIVLTTGSLTMTRFENNTICGGATIDTGTSGMLTLTESLQYFNFDIAWDTVTIGGSGTVNHHGHSTWSVSDSSADIDLRVDAKITGNGATASDMLSFGGNGTVLLTNPNNDFNLRVSGSRVLLGAVGAEGTGEIYVSSGRLGAATGTTLTLDKDIRFVTSLDGGFAGDVDLTVTGRINTGPFDSHLYFDNTGLVTLTGQIANFEDPTIRTITFGSSGTVVLSNPGNDYRMKLEGATVLLGASGAQGTGEMELYSGHLGVAAGGPVTVTNDIRLTGGDIVFIGSDNLILSGNLNTGAVDRLLTLDGTALVTLAGGMGNFDTGDVRQLTFQGAGDLAVSIPGNPVSNVSIHWDSTGALTFTAPQQLAGNFSVCNGSAVLNGN